MFNVEVVLRQHSVKREKRSLPGKVRRYEKTDAEMDFEEDSLQEHLLNVYDPTSTDRHVLYKLLLNALRSKDYRTFKNIIEYNLKKQSPVLDVNYVFPNHYEETCLDIASRNGLMDFVSYLLSKGAKINRVNEAHNRAPIHFATENGHERTLAVLLTHSTTNVNLEAGQQTALHIAVRQENLTCARQLLEARASANIPNSKGLTALHMAAMNGQREMVRLILDVCKQCPDLDSYKDYNDQTTRQVLQENLPDLPLPPKCEGREVNAQDLKYYLTANDEVNFLKSLGVVKPQIFHGVAEDLLEMAAQHNFLNAVVGILDGLQGSIFSVKKAAQVAVREGYHCVLRLLLNVKPDVANDLILDACLELGMPGKHGVDNTSDRLECLKLILEQENVDVRCADDKGNTPLHYAARASCHEAVTLLLERGSYIGHMNRFNVPPVADISASTLSRYLDDCLQTRKYRTNEYTIEFDYRCLMPHVDGGSTDGAHRPCREMEVFRYIACNNGLKHLLKHPLLSSFLYLKWHRIRHFLYANFFFYMTFYLLLNAYILSMTCHSSSSKNKTETVSVGSSHDVALNGSLRIASWSYENFLHPFVSVMLLLFVCREMLQLFSCPRHYFKSLQNWLELALIGMTLSVLCGAGSVLGAMVILLSAWNLVLLISQHPRMSTGVEMFRTVSLNFVRFLFPYIFLILAFALAFFTLFKDADDNFPDPGHSFFKTIIMLTGEFDAADISFESHPLWSHLVFIFFVFLIAIVLFNLLNGLAVSDTADILCKAELVGLVSRIHLVTYVEHVVFGKLFRHWLCRNQFKCLTRKILLFPNYLVDGKISIKPSDNLDAYENDRRYTKYTRGESIKKYNRWATLKMDPSIIKKAKRIICDKKQLSDNEKIMITLSKLQEKLTVMEDTLNTIKLAVENNNVNNTIGHAV